MSSVLSFRNLTCLDFSDSKCLHGISAVCEASTLTAIMSANCFQRQALLKIVYGNNDHQHISGTVFINGHSKRQHAFSQHAAYVNIPKNQTILSTSSCFLLLQAKIEQSQSTIEAQQHCWTKIMHYLQIQSPQQLDVPIEMLSSADQVCVSIVLQLISDPLFVFIEDPIENMDTQSSIKVMFFLQRLKSDGKTILCSMSSVSNTVLAQNDKVLLLSNKGSLGYFGPVGPQCCSLLNFFETMNEMNSYDEDKDALITHIYQLMDSSTEKIQVTRNYQRSFLNESNLKNVGYWSEPKGPNIYSKYDGQCSLGDLIWTRIRNYFGLALDRFFP